MSATVATKAATPERWQAALRRAHKEGVEVAQVNTSGMWIATSGTQRGKCYEIEVVKGLAMSCSCQAGSDWNDPVCKHRARYYFDQGLLELLLDEHGRSS
jgi:hypothetical protein